MGKRFLEKVTSPRPRAIEVTALIAAVLVLLAGGATIFFMPAADHTRDKILGVLSVVISALGVASLLFVWAQLRHSATQATLVAYHQYFQDFPKAEKVNALYKVFGRLSLEPPIWQAPLTNGQAKTIFSDRVVAPDTAPIVIREYLNDFEEFAAAINSGLVDEDYAYHIENVRVLNCYYGFEEVIKHYAVEDSGRAAQHRSDPLGSSDYYGELKRLAENWRDRKREELASEEEEERKRRAIPKKL